jgi:cell division septal protein FtsQ
MGIRSRTAKQREERLPAIWRPPAVAAPQAEASERQQVQHGARSRIFVSWRLFSALIVVSLGTVLFLFFSADAFYVHSIAVGGLTYMTKEEVFALTDIANVHIFWVDPEEVRRSLLRSATIADAEVRIGWPPHMVQIIVEERQPALVWEQNGVATWIDLQGRVMRQRADDPDLLRIQAMNLPDATLGQTVPIDVVTGALQLRSMYPNIDVLHFDANDGLGYMDGRGWEVWFGIGTDMPEKILIYNAIVDDLLARGIFPYVVNLANPDAPYYSVSQGS